MSGFDLEASNEVDLEVSAGAPGAALVSGRLLADITRALPPHPVDVTVDGARLSIACGAARFTLPTMPVEDYPSLPKMPTTAGTVKGAEFAAAVAQVAVAAGRDDTLPMLTGVRLEIDGDKLTLAATDRYRLAVRELTWEPEDPNAARSAGAGAGPRPGRRREEPGAQRGADDRAVRRRRRGAGSGIIGFSGETNGRASRATTRLLDATFPPYRSLLPSEWSSSAEVAVAPLVEAVKRVALVAERNAPVRLEFADAALSLTAGGGAEQRPGRGAARGRLRRRHHRHRVQPTVPARRPRRAVQRHRNDAVHLAHQAGGAAARGARGRRVHLPDHAGATARLSACTSAI